MPKKQSLALHEEIMLLALHDKKGTVSSEYYAYALGGAVMADLLLGGRLGVVEERKKKFVELRNARPLGNAVLDECLAKVAEAKRRATAEKWVSRFAGLKGLKHGVAQQLCRRGILRADEGKVLWLFTRKIYPEIDPTPERDLVRRLEKAIFSETADVDPHTVVLVSLANSADLLKLVLDRKQLKTRKDRIERLANGELTGKATRAAIEAMQAAVAISIMMPVFMTTVINS